MKKRIISLLLGLGLLCSVAACGQTDTVGDLSGMAGVTASSTTSAVQTPEQTLKATQTPEPSVQTTQTPAQEKTQKPEKTTKATAKPKATKSDEKAAKQRGFFRNGVYYGYGKEISQSGVQVFGKIQTCHFARQRESAGLFAVQSV